MGKGKWDTVWICHFLGAEDMNSSFLILILTKLCRSDSQPISFKGVRSCQGVPAFGGCVLLSLSIFVPSSKSSVLPCSQSPVACLTNFVWKRLVPLHKTSCSAYFSRAFPNALDFSTVSIPSCCWFQSSSHDNFYFYNPTGHGSFNLEGSITSTSRLSTSEKRKALIEVILCPIPRRTLTSGNSTHTRLKGCRKKCSQHYKILEINEENAHNITKFTNWCVPRMKSSHPQDVWPTMNDPQPKYNASEARVTINKPLGLVRDWAPWSAEYEHWMKRTG